MRVDFNRLSGRLEKLDAIIAKVKEFASEVLVTDYNSKVA